MCVVLVERVVSPGKGIGAWIRQRQMETLSMHWIEVRHSVLDIGSTLPGIILSFQSFGTLWAGFECGVPRRSGYVAWSNSDDVSLDQIAKPDLELKYNVHPGSLPRRT
jgi:hypothetical protein